MEYVISTDPGWLDVDVIHQFLSEHSYWARGIPRETVTRSIANYSLIATRVVYAAS
jgi:hypothetical protein